MCVYVILHNLIFYSCHFFNALFSFYCFQACRGENFDPGVVLDHGLKSDADLDSDSDDEEEYIHKLPREADFLYYYSTVPGR